jgi:hypothetical protein
METKQTAVEWLIQELGEYFPHEIGGIHLMVEQAKQMEKEQIIDAYNKNLTGFNKLEQEEIGLNWSEDFYNETYGN